MPAPHPPELRARAVELARERARPIAVLAAPKPGSGVRALRDPRPPRMIYTHRTIRASTALPDLTPEPSRKAGHGHCCEISAERLRRGRRPEYESYLCPGGRCDGLPVAPRQADAPRGLPSSRPSLPK